MTMYVCVYISQVLLISITVLRTDFFLRNIWNECVSSCMYVCWSQVLVSFWQIGWRRDGRIAELLFHSALRALLYVLEIGVAFKDTERTPTQRLFVLKPSLKLLDTNIYWRHCISTVEFYDSCFIAIYAIAMHNIHVFSHFNHDRMVIYDYLFSIWLPFFRTILIFPF